MYKLSFYVDDMLKPVATPDAAAALIKEMVSLLLRGGFKLTKFASTKTSPQEDRAKSFKAVDLNDSTLPQDTALGLQWSIKSDSFLYDVEWDEAIPADLLAEIRRWVSVVPELRSLRIPRCIKPLPD